jgi:predicted RNA binding protein YcfA (HicA-like mRNA interferase family)
MITKLSAISGTDVVKYLCRKGFCVSHRKGATSFSETVIERLSRGKILPT